MAAGKLEAEKLRRSMDAGELEVEEDEFNDFCQETLVDAALDKIDDFVEEQILDALSSEKTTVEEIQEKVSRLRKDEIEQMTSLLKKVEDSNNALKARIELLKEREDLTAARDVLNKVTQWNCALLNLRS